MPKSSILAAVQDCDVVDVSDIELPTREKKEPPVSARWSKMRLSHKQRQFMDSNTRFNVLPAGRRSGKTEIAKRRAIRKALRFSRYEDGWFLFTAPTHSQAKRIYWNDVKRLVPSVFLAPDGISESELSIYLINGVKLQVMGMDVAERSEGTPLDHIVLDEYGNMKSSVWTEHIRPALTDRFGTADFIGVPEGRNHYYKLDQAARTDTSGEWMAHHWTTAEILHLYLGFRADEQACANEEELSALRSGDRLRLGRLLAHREIQSAKRSLDELTYKQEYLASFIAFAGRVYYTFTEANLSDVRYDPNLPLQLCFDFNVSPGVAVVVQEQNGKTCCIDEVYIENDSNTPMVCDRLILDYGHHTGDVWCYGDATGGNRGTAQTSGSNWAIIERSLSSVFGGRVILDVPQSNPPERDRINAMNSRCKTMDNVYHLLVNPHRCPHLIRDFEGVRVVPGSAGVIDKKNDKELTHLTDALGYYVHQNFPVGGGDRVKISPI